MWEKVQETVNFIKEKTNFIPEYGVILGSGLGQFTDDITIELSVEYSAIPNFPISTVQGHKGALVFGTIQGKKVVAMQGRFHYYEGYDMKQVTFPVRVMKFLGIQKLIVSNASGGVNPAYKVGDIVVITDHINMLPEHPLRGQNDERFGPRFVNMSEPYSTELINKAFELANQLKIDLKTGVYLALQGPTFETLAEYKMVKAIGADCVGMSTVPEVIVARHMDIPCFAVSIITDLGVPGKIEKVSVQDVINVASKQEPKMTIIMKELIARI